MERLTTRDANCADPKTLYGVWVRNHDYISAANRLADYEDTELAPEEVTALGNLFDYALEESKTLTEQLELLKRLRELAEADREGRLVVLPCKDCKYMAGALPNDKGFLICPASGMEIIPDDFCSYGEPREV